MKHLIFHVSAEPIKKEQGGDLKIAARRQRSVDTPFFDTTLFLSGESIFVIQLNAITKPP
jgi:hypothetical protein